ncbi:FAD-dependent monooxygenase [Piscirickettsia salmonis]|uniref:FAD-dependent monooxygenase n=1 Tax=Piscirickettsia salmonis TaxID=1238 RepID=UPI000F090893|nr:ubiquinone biosynthesis protein [Piscirickettsiaceae bacterium NZ-RLO2]
MQEVDIAIVGGGVIGSSLAVALAQFTDFKVALIDALPAEHQVQLSALDQRSIALSLASCRLFKHLGLWSCLQISAQPIEHIEVSEQGAWSKTRLDAQALGYRAFGYVIPLYQIQQALNEKIHSQSSRDSCQSTLIHQQGMRLCQLDFNQADHAVLTLQADQQKTQLAAKLVVGADGTSSTVRRLAGMPIEQYDYQQQALVVNLQLKHDHRSRSFERFTQSGSLGLLPLTERRLALFWAAPTNEITSLLALPEQDFIERLYEVIGYSLGRCTSIGRRMVFPLKKTVVKSAWRERCVLLGNAEHTLHPLSGQGLNLGLYDLACLVDRFIDIDCALDQDALGSAAMLARYSQSKQRRNQHIMHDVDCLLTGFANPLAVVGRLRRTWLSNLELVSLLRQARVKKTVGYQLPGLLTIAGFCDHFGLDQSVRAIR